MLQQYVHVVLVSILLIPNKYFSSFINVLFFMRVTEIIEITQNITDVILLLFKWTRFTPDLSLYKGNLKVLATLFKT